MLCQVPMPSTRLAQTKIRPAVIVSKNKNNERLDDVMVVPCSSTLDHSAEPTQYLLLDKELERSGIRFPSVIRCESVMTLPKAIILRKLGKLSVAVMQRINESLLDALALTQ